MPAPRLLSSAWEDLSDIADYQISYAGPDAAEAVTDGVLDTIALLETMPLLGPLHHDPVLQVQGYRKLLCGQYVCVYRVLDGVPTVYRIFYSRRDCVWRARE